MGTIKQGILGGFSGKVGTMVGSSWKDISYMRGRAQSVRNPRTEGQMEQRSKFAQVLELLKPITAYVRIGFKTYAKQQTAFNAAMAYNVKNAFSGTYPNFVFDHLRHLCREVISRKQKHHSPQLLVVYSSLGQIIVANVQHNLLTLQCHLFSIL